MPASMEEVYHPFRTPSGRLIARGPAVDTWDEGLKEVSGGEVVIAAAAQAAHYYPRPKVVYVPVRDAPPCRWAFAWQTANANPLIRAFAAVVDSSRSDA
jgi:hypothetical protein